MYKDSTELAEELLEESAGLLGMIAEVKSKALLLKNQNKRKMANCLAGSPEEPTEDWEEEVGFSVEQMQADLATYQHRLEEIYEELAGYGIVPDVP
tara:strand:- start:650 stop:937 length:288 start_codon:yes stop_codon:yes gene_type:complete